MPDEQTMPMPVKMKTPLDELITLAEIADNEKYMTVLRRVARRLIENLRNQAFTLNEKDNFFPLRHTEYRNQAIGADTLVKLI